MTATDQVIFVCRSRWELTPDEADSILLGPSRLTTCAECGNPVWILVLHLEAHPDLKAVCNRCAVKAGYIDHADIAPETVQVFEEMGFTKATIAVFREQVKKAVKEARGH